MTIKTTTFVVLSLSSFICYCPDSYAVVDANTCITTTPVSTFSVPDMTIRRDVPVGTVIGTTIVTPAINTFSCSGYFSEQGLYVKGYGVASKKIDGMNIFKLGRGDTGIGFAVYGNAVNECPGYRPVIGDSSVGGTNVRELCTVKRSFEKQPVQGSMKVVFYKVGNIVPGLMQSQLLGSFALRLNSEVWWGDESSVHINPFTVNAVGCSVDNAHVQVPLGEVGMSALASAGRTAAEREFSIPLNCDIGTKIKLTISPATGGVYDATKGLLNLTEPMSTETARGVKVQVLLDGIPVMLQQPLKIGVQTSNGVFDIPLTARYYRTGDTLTAGAADSSAIYTITYE